MLTKLEFKILKTSSNSTSTTTTTSRIPRLARDSKADSRSNQINLLRQKQIVIKSRARRTPTVHCEINSKKPHFQYNSYQ
eukprot:2818270-Rhodomonas_salina.1